MKINISGNKDMIVQPNLGDAGFDLKTPEEVAFSSFYQGDELYNPGMTAIIDTGVHVEIPDGYYGKIEGRSSLGAKGFTIMGGVIDSSYRGPIKVAIMCLGNSDHTFEAGDKIAQLIIQPCITPELNWVESLEETSRGDGGFGSTGR